MPPMSKGNLSFRMPLSDLVPWSAANKAGKAAPYLKGYFETLEKAVSEFEPEQALEISGDAEAQRQAQLKKGDEDYVLRRYVSEAFTAHDKDGSGHLNPEEGYALLCHYVDLFVPFQKRMGVAMLKKSAVLQGKMLHCPPDELKKESKALQKAWKEDLDQKHTYFEEHKEELQKEGFKVMDAAGDGRLAKQEVMDALTPNSPKWYALHKALKLFDEAEQEIIPNLMSQASMLRLNAMRSPESASDDFGSTEFLR